MFVAPYLMGAAMSGATTVRGANVDVDLSASDIFSNPQFGARGLLVARKGGWGVGTDLIWMALGTTVRDTNVDFNQGAFAFYGLRELGPRVDVTFGARINTLQGALFDEVIGAFSIAYADQDEKDHAVLDRAVKKGPLKAKSEGDRQ